jgi:hypothetical protein
MILYMQMDGFIALTMYRSFDLKLFLLLALTHAALVQCQVYTTTTITYYYTVAIQIVQVYNNPTNAVPATCPADHPVSCNGISQGNL